MLDKASFHFVCVDSVSHQPLVGLYASTCSPDAEDTFQRTFPVTKLVAMKAVTVEAALQESVLSDRNACYWVESSIAIAEVRFIDGSEAFR